MVVDVFVSNLVIETLQTIESILAGLLVCFFCSQSSVRGRQMLLDWTKWSWFTAWKTRSDKTIIYLTKPTSVMHFNQYSFFVPNSFLSYVFLFSFALGFGPQVHVCACYHLFRFVFVLFSPARLELERKFAFLRSFFDNHLFRSLLS